jgi:hypothetical protein
MPDGLAALRPYQTTPGRAILASVLSHSGLTFTVEMSRQAGKNELSAQLETAILSIAAADTGAIPGDVSIIKAAPTFTPQAEISIRRLRAALRRARLPYTIEAGHIVHVANSNATFLSAEPTANVVGHTANPLLEIDEAQDIDPDKYDRDFAPFAAAFNATRVFYGTAWTEDSLLQRERKTAIRRQQADGIQRAFLYPWPHVAAVIPDYGRYVATERDRLGPTHPLFTTQYELIPLAGKGRLLSPTHRLQLAGDHPRLDHPPATAPALAAGLDLAGGASHDVADTHDLTVLTLAAVTPPSPADPIPDNHVAVIHHISWQGEPHDRLLPQLLDILRNVWPVTTLAVDATGLGQTTATLLGRGLPKTKVLPVTFTRAGKSDLGYALQASIATGRCKTYTDDGSPDSTALWHQAKYARADYYPSQAMNFYLDPADGHDDHIVSLALTIHAAQHATPRIARGRRPT